MADMLQRLTAKLASVGEQGRWSETRDAVDELGDLLMQEVSQFQASYAKRAITVPA